MKPSYLHMDAEGREIPDDTPVVIRIKGNVISQFDEVRAFIRRELREHQSGEIETFEEANDFDVEDDLFPVGAAEYAEDTEAADREVIAAGDPTQPRPPQVNSGKPEATTGGASSAPAVQAGAAPPAPSEPAAQ